MTYQEAVLTLSQNIISNDYDTALTTCDSFPEMDFTEKEELRNLIIDLLGDVNILQGKNVDDIVDKFNFDKADNIKAILEINRGNYTLLTKDKIENTKGYQLLANDQTEYYNDAERATLIRGIANLAILSRNLELIQFALGKVQKYGI